MKNITPEEVLALTKIQPKVTKWPEFRTIVSALEVGSNLFVGKNEFVDHGYGKQAHPQSFISKEKGNYKVQRFVEGWVISRIA